MSLQAHPSLAQGAAREPPSHLVPLQIENGEERLRRVGSRSALVVWSLRPGGVVCFPRESRTVGVGRCMLHILPPGAQTGTRAATPGALPAGDGAWNAVITDHMTPFAFRSDTAQTIEGISFVLPRHQIGASLLQARGRTIPLPSGAPLTLGLAAFVGAFAQACLTVAGANDIDPFGDALAATLRIVLQEIRTPQVQGVDDAWPSRMDPIFRFIDQHLLSTELSPELIAGEFAMSRAALYRLFEPLGGVARFIRLQRMAWAAARIAEEGPSPRLMSILSRKLGFSSKRGFEKAYSAALAELKKQ